MRIQERTSSPRLCPLCHDELSETAYTCPDCETDYHQACVEELGGCATLGCELKGEIAEESPGPSLAERMAKAHARAQELNERILSRQERIMAWSLLAAGVLFALFSVLCFYIASLGLEDSRGRTRDPSLGGVFVGVIAFALLQGSLRELWRARAGGAGKQRSPAKTFLVAGSVLRFGPDRRQLDLKIDPGAARVLDEWGGELWNQPEENPYLGSRSWFKLSCTEPVKAAAGDSLTLVVLAAPTATAGWDFHLAGEL